MSSPLVTSTKKDAKGSGKCNEKEKKGEKTPSTSSSNRPFVTEELDDLSMALSVLSKPMKLATQILPGFFADKATEKLLKDVLSLPQTMIDCTPQIGLTTPQRIVIVNAFGLDISTIANFFLQFGHEFTVDMDTKKHCVNLILFTCHQVLRPRLMPKEDNIHWNTVKRMRMTTMDSNHFSTPLLSTWLTLTRGKLVQWP